MLPIGLSNSSTSEILNAATASTSVLFHPPAAGKGTPRDKTGVLEPSDLSKLRVTAEIFTSFKSPTASGNLQPAIPAAGSNFGLPAVLFETILCPTSSTTSLNGASLGEVAINETQEPNDSRSSCLLPKEQIPKRGSKHSYMKGRCIIYVGNLAHRFKLCESMTVGFILEDLSASNAQGGEYVLTASGKVKRDKWILAENNTASRVLCLMLMKVEYDHAMSDVCGDLLTCMHACKTPGAMRWTRAQNYGSPVLLRGKFLVNLVIKGGANIQ